MSYSPKAYTSPGDYSDDSSLTDSSQEDYDIKLEKQPAPSKPEVKPTAEPTNPKKPYEMVEVKPKRTYVRRKPVEAAAMAAKMQKARDNKKPLPPKEEKPKKKIKEPVQIIKNYYYQAPAPTPAPKDPPKVPPKQIPPKIKPLIFI